MDFTDKVMMKIAAEMVLRERRRARWFTALYIFIGIAAAALIAVLFNVFNVITFETWGSIFSSIIPKDTPATLPTHIVSPDLSGFQTVATAIGSTLTTAISFIHAHSIAAIITANAIILTLVARFLAPKNGTVQAR